MIKLSKEKGCEKIGDWIKGVRNHLYWCVTSTKQGFQELIAAKWQSFMQHVSNKHDGHPNPMFTKCAHEEIGSRRWIKIGGEKVYLYYIPVWKVGNLQFHVIQLAYIVHCSPSIRHTFPHSKHIVCVHPKHVFLLWLYLDHSYIALINRFNFSDHDNINVFYFIWSLFDQRKDFF